jgi:predicted RNA-binding protein YlqC (UPF0109 family)
LNSQSNNENFLDYLTNLNNENQNDKVKILFKIKNLLLEIYQVVKNVETKRLDFLVLVKYLKISTICSDFSTILNNFMGVKIENLSYNTNDNFTMLFKLPIVSSDVGTLVGRKGVHLKQLENEYKCHLKALKSEDENANIEIKVWADNYINFKSVEKSLHKKLHELALTNPTLEFNIGNYYSNDKSMGNLIGRNGSRITLMESFYTCRIKIIKDKNGNAVCKIWAETKTEAFKIKSTLLNKIQLIEEENKEHYDYLNGNMKSESEIEEEEWEIDNLLDIKYSNSTSFSKKRYK